MKKEKYAIQIIPVDSYKKGQIFLVKKAVKVAYRQLPIICLKLGKVFLTIVNASVCSDASQYSGAINIYHKIASTWTDKKKKHYNNTD